MLHALRAREETSQHAPVGRAMDARRAREEREAREMCEAIQAALGTTKTFHEKYGCEFTFRAGAVWLEVMPTFDHRGWQVAVSHGRVGLWLLNIKADDRAVTLSSKYTANWELGLTRWTTATAFLIGLITRPPEQFAHMCYVPWRHSHGAQTPAPDT